MTMLTAEERVRKGIAFLDHHGPEGWRDKIDLDMLDVGCVSECVLSQIYRDGDFIIGFNIGCDALGIFADGDAPLCGFESWYIYNRQECDGYGDDFEELNEAWKRILSLPIDKQ